MLLKTLAAMILAFPWKSDRPSLPPSAEEDGILPWERTPAEQRHRRSRAEQEASQWLRLPRGY